MVNKFSSPPTGTENILPVGYIFKAVLVFGDYFPVRKYIQSSGCFFPAAGDRYPSDGVLHDIGVYATYWSSSPTNSSSAYNLDATSGGANPASYDSRAFGLSVRCVKEFISNCPLD
ncbi:MAG: hypothetical protein LBR26_08880 [Prevotella sp.]|nr:hypothetical protein [Prevotella sp.]